VVGGRDVRDRDGVGSEVERLLYRAALRPEHLGDHSHSLGPDQRDDPVEGAQVEQSVLDVEHHGVVAGDAAHLHGGSRGLGEPDRRRRLLTLRAVLGWVRHRFASSRVTRIALTADVNAKHTL
jgi:hypothetical protein